MSRAHAGSVSASSCSCWPSCPSSRAAEATPARSARPAHRTGRAPLTAGYGRVTPAFQRTIDRVVADGSTAGRDLADRVSPAPSSTTWSAARCSRASATASARAGPTGPRRRCAPGWPLVATRQAARPATATTTGDLSALAALRQAAAAEPGRPRAAAQRAELTEAARSVAKVWLLRHQIQGVRSCRTFFLGVTRRSARRPPPAAARRPRPRRHRPAVGRQQVKHWRDYPDKGVVLDPQHVAEQHRTYWCGPTSMQMITWGWSDRRRSQAHWARRLGTTTSGTAITSMVRRRQPGHRLGQAVVRRSNAHSSSSSTPRRRGRIAPAARTHPRPARQPGPHQAPSSTSRRTATSPGNARMM